MRSNKPGHRPEGNTACVEVVETSELLPDDVVWGEDGWYCVLEGEENDSTQIVAAPIIDDAGGQGESLMLYGEKFLRVVPAPDPSVGLAPLQSRLAAAESDAARARGALVEVRRMIESDAYRASITARIDAHLASRPEGEVRHG